MDDWIARGGLKAVPRQRLRVLSVRSDVRGGLQTASHLGALAATASGLLVVHWAPAAVVPFIAQGVLLNCLYASQHELSHWTAFRTKWLNDRFGELFGFLNLNPFHTDRWAHFAHHRAPFSASSARSCRAMSPGAGSAQLARAGRGGRHLDLPLRTRPAALRNHRGRRPRAVGPLGRGADHPPTRAGPLRTHELA
jgi:hypothetical protein